MKYYLHDTSSFEDEKVALVYNKFGYEGIGLFYTILEKIAKQEKPVMTEVLKSQLRVGKRLEKCWSYMEEIGIISSSNGQTFNERILNYSQKYQIKKEKNREKISEWRKNQDDEKNVTGNSSESNHSKVKESKVKVDKGSNRAKALVEPSASTRVGKADYEKVVNEITGKEPKEVWTALKTFITENDPDFIDPYIDAWNVFASNYKLNMVESISDSRRAKFKTRHRERAFDFFRILEMIKTSAHLKGADGGWKVTFDWILENDKNYLKIIEGNYNG